MRIKRTIFWGFGGLCLVFLSGVRRCCPSVMNGSPLSVLPADTLSSGIDSLPDTPTLVPATPVSTPVASASDESLKTYGSHRILSVPDFGRAFPDLQEVQLASARRWGVSPVSNREQAERRKTELVYVGSSPYYGIDSAMSSSIPYLVPRAARLLHDIGRCYLDSLAAKGVPAHRVVVSSVLRTEEDVARLVRHNHNASEQSCHRFGTTFDICYNRYEIVSPPGQTRRAVRNDTLKWVLAEVLNDLRQQGRCHVKYEVKQGCFHITTR